MTNNTPESERFDPHGDWWAENADMKRSICLSQPTVKGGSLEWYMHHDAVAELIEKAYRAGVSSATPSPWKDIESAPACTSDEDPVEVLLSDGKVIAMGYVVIRRDGSKRGKASYHSGFEWTHWMPLPPPPTQEKTK